MNYPRLVITLLACLLTAAPSWSQEEPTTASETASEESEQEEKEKTADDNKTAEKPAVAIKRPQRPPREHQKMLHLAEQLKLEPEQIQWLPGTPYETLAIYRENLTGNPFGAILLLHAEGESALWPETVASLLEQLPEYGWNTLSVSLPLPTEKKAPSRHSDTPSAPDTEDASIPDTDENKPAASDKKENTEVATDPDNTPLELQDPGEAPEETLQAVADGDSTSEDSLNSFTASKIKAPSSTSIEEDENVALFSPEVQSNDRLRAAHQFLQNHGQLNLSVVSFGLSSLRVAQYLSSLDAPSKLDQMTKGMIRPVQALVMVNSRNQLPLDAGDTALLLKDPDLPILDLYFGVDLRDGIEAKRRRGYARRNNVKDFYQINFPELAGPVQNNNRLAKRVRGFINKHARGEEMGAYVTSRR